MSDTGDQYERKQNSAEGEQRPGRALPQAEWETSRHRPYCETQHDTEYMFDQHCHATANATMCANSRGEHHHNTQGKQHGNGCQQQWICT